MSDHEEIEPSPWRTCVIHDVLAFEPVDCAKCQNGPLCADCVERCETCGETYCKGEPGEEGCLEHHGCKRKADPADVLVLEGEYATNWMTQLDAAYSINGRTYFVTSPRGRGHEEPPDATIYRYDRVKERDVWVSGPNASGFVAQPHVESEVVGRFDGVLGRTVWEDDEAEQDHREASDDDR